MKEHLLALKNKDFAYKCINILIEKERKLDIELLKDVNFCKRNFDMNFAILQEVPPYGNIPEDFFKDSRLNRRYYPQPIIAFGKKYIVCNDWYYNNKVNQRDTKSHFVNWVLK